MSAQKFCYDPLGICRPSCQVPGHSATIYTASLSLSAPLLVDFCFYHRPVQLYRVQLGSRANSHGAWYTSFLYTKAVSVGSLVGILYLKVSSLQPTISSHTLRIYWESIIQRLIHLLIA